MRYLIALAFCCLLASPQAHACRPGDEHSHIFATIPDPQPDADVIAKVSLSDVNRGLATANVIQVIKASDARVRQGAKIAAQGWASGCSPGFRKGDEGIIIAKVGTDIEDRLVLCAYSHYPGRGAIAECRPADVEAAIWHDVFRG